MTTPPDDDPPARPADHQPPDTEPEIGSAASPQSGPARPPAGRFGPPGRPFAQSPFIFGLTAGLGLLLVYLGFLAVRNVGSILSLVVVAAFLAVGLNPAVVRLQRFGMPRGLAVTVVVLATFIVVCGGLFALIPPIISEGTQFVQDVPGYIENLKNARWVNDLNERFNLLDRMESAAESAAKPENLANIVGGVLGGIKLIFGTVFSGLTVFILTLYFLVAFDRLKDGAYKFVPASRRERAQCIGDEILAKVGGYMVGSLAIATIAGITAGIFMVIVGIPYAIALAVIVAICDIIPQIGAMLGGIVLTLVGLSQSVAVGIAALVFFVLYQQLENWVIYPRVMGRVVRVSDLAAILSVLVGAAMLGVVGVLLAIPAVAAIQLIVREVVFPRQEIK